jgi:hypothetical protein
MIQRMACLAFTGAMKSNPTVAMEVLLNLIPLKSSDYGGGENGTLQDYMSKQPVDLKTETGLLSICKNASDPILDMRSDHTIPVYNLSKIFNVIINMDYWRNKDPVLPKYALI